jgi:hypothetical protein
MIEEFKQLKNKLSDKCTGEIDESGFYTIKEICKTCNPKNILEVGFNRGNSALMWLLNSNANLTSIDIRKESSIIDSLTTLKEKFGTRFKYIEKDAYLELHLTDEWINKFDLIFIDAWHTPIGYEIDTLTAKYLGCDYIVYDDYVSHRNSPYIQNFIKSDLDLEEIGKYDTNQGLIKVITNKPGDGNILKKIKQKVKSNRNEFNNLKKVFNK